MFWGTTESRLDDSQPLHALPGHVHDHDQEVVRLVFSHLQITVTSNTRNKPASTVAKGP